MTGGFEAVPEEIRGAAGSIESALAEAAGLNWDGPSGDYGHAGVHAGWRQFIEDARAHVNGLHEQAGEHGRGLHQAAAGYVATDDEANRQVSGVTGSGG